MLGNGRLLFASESDLPRAIVAFIRLNFASKFSGVVNDSIVWPGCFHGVFFQYAHKKTIGNTFFSIFNREFHSILIGIA